MVRYTFNTPATRPNAVNSRVIQGAVPNHESSTRPNHQPNPIATTNESMPALNSHAVRSMFASDLLKPATELWIIHRVLRGGEVVVTEAPR